MPRNLNAPIRKRYDRRRDQPAPPPRPRKMPGEVYEEIIRRALAGEKQAALAREFGLSQSYVCEFIGRYRKRCGIA